GLAEGGKDVLHPLHQDRPVAQEVVAAVRAGIQRRARDGKHLAALFAGEPDRNDASTTTTPSDIPETMRLRRGKDLAWGSRPGGISLTRAPRARISS